MRREIAIFAAAIALSVSCSEINPECGDGNIRINAGMAEELTATKAPLSPSDLTSGSTIKVYDILGTSHTKHINGVTATKGASEWSFASDYQWLVGSPTPARVDHNFFAWLTKDKDDLTPASLFGSDPALHTNSPDNGVYTLTLQKQMLLNVSQFDFCWSDMVQRPSTSSNYSVVNLDLHHLFSCFGISAKNYSSSRITIKSIKLHGLVNNKTATVTYNINTGASSVVYTADGSTPKSWTTDGNAMELLASDIVLNADGETGNSVANVITASGAGSKPTNAAAYWMMWPQTDAEMDNTVRQDAGVWVYDSPAEPVLVVTYRTAGSMSDVVVPLAIRPESLDGQGWDAGTRHCIELSFTEKFLTLKATAMPWDYSEPEIDYTEGASAPLSGILAFTGGIQGTGANADCIYFKNDNPITGYFLLNTPKDATWMIAKDGDFDAFEIDNRDESEFGDGIDYNYGTINGETAYFTIYPKITDPQRDYVITLSFAVRTSSGNVINIDDIIQPKVEAGVIVKVDGKTVLAKKKIVLLAS